MHLVSEVFQTREARFCFCLVRIKMPLLICFRIRNPERGAFTGGGVAQLRRELRANLIVFRSYITRRVRRIGATKTVANSKVNFGQFCANTPFQCPLLEISDQKKFEGNTHSENFSAMFSKSLACLNK